MDQLPLGARQPLYVRGVLLFCGRDPVSRLVQALTVSRYSHVGLWLEGADRRQYCFESTGSLSDVVLHSTPPCVQLNLLPDVVSSYCGLVRSRVIRSPERVDVSDFVYSKVGTSYETHLSSLVRALARTNTTDGSDSYFCSELVAAALHAGRCLDAAARSADNYLPRDFARASQNLKLCAGVTLARERTVRSAPRFCCSG